MNEKAQWQNRTGSFSNPRLQCPPRHPSTVCSRWAAGVAGRERKRERGEQGLHQGCSLDRANKSRPVTCSMAPFEEWGKFGQSDEKGRHSLFSLPKQLTARDRQEAIALIMKGCSEGLSLGKYLEPWQLSVFLRGHRFFLINSSLGSAWTSHWMQLPRDCDSSTAWKRYAELKETSLGNQTLAWHKDDFDF
ncbi:hypothetical protein PAMP_007491 [Pampus punctatissimus]